MRSWDRAYRLVLGTSEITGLNIEFDVKKNLKKEPNRASLRVYNLSESTRRAIQGKDLPVELRAGYTGDMPLGASTEAALADIGLGVGSALPLLYAGTLRYAASAQDESMAWITSIASGDGDRAVTKARTKKAYRAGTPWTTIIKDLADDMGLDSGNALELMKAPELALKRLAGTLATRGASATELSRVLGAIGYDWSVQDGALQMLKRGQATTTKVVELSADSGLIGSPEIALRADPRAGKGPKAALAQPQHFIRARSLLNGVLVPGCKVSIQAAMIKGFYRVEAVTHWGSTHEQTWYTDMEATEL